MKCKIFEHHISRIHYLEMSINDFLADESIKVVSITQSSDTSGAVVLAIFYKEVLASEETADDETLSLG